MWMSHARHPRRLQWTQSIDEEPAVRVFFPAGDAGFDNESDMLVPYRCGLPFALDIDAAAPGGGATPDQRLIVISSPGDKPIARD